jgi:hypothetical protein
VPLKTTQGCLNAYMEELPVSLLPRNFQDAMKITIELGFRYLWIDSLCIIQDSLQDWEHECTVMGDVYANASITISAAAAKSCDEGILHPKLYEHPRLRKHNVLLKLEEVSPLEDTVQVSSNYGHEDFADCFDSLPLGKRGWCLQERLLSQRVLYYAERQIYFQCRTSHLAANEVPPRDFYKVEVTRSNLLHFPDSTEKTSKMLLAEIYDRWLSIINAYCTFRRLAISSDKLPAILGIAKKFQKHLKDEYISGFWRMDFRRSILWYTCKNSLNKVIKHESRAPSWSWARWDANLHFLLRSSSQICEEFSAELLNSGAGPNNLSDGKVSQDLKALHLRAWTKHFTPDQVCEMADNLHVDLVDDDSFKPQSLERQPSIEHMAYMPDPMLKQRESLEDPVYSLVIVSLQVSSVEDGLDECLHQRWQMYSLLLKHIYSKEELIYERAGLVTHHVDGDLDLDRLGWYSQEITII